MRTPRKIKQPLVYALLRGKEPIYERDEEGKIIYLIIAGEKIPKKTGEMRDTYSTPITFYNSISGQLTEDELKAFGTQSNVIAKMTYRRGQYPFRVGTLIWKNSEVQFYDDGTPDPSSADYRIVGIMGEGQYFWKCLLEAVTKNEANKTES